MDMYDWTATKVHEHALLVWERKVKPPKAIRFQKVGRPLVFYSRLVRIPAHRRVRNVSHGRMSMPSSLRAAPSRHTTM